MGPTTFTYSGNDPASAAVKWDASATGEVDVGRTTDIATSGSLQFADMTGDGFDDMVYFARDRWWMRPSTGSTFGAAAQMTDPMVAIDQLPPPSVLFDHDSNGTIDLTTHGRTASQATKRVQSWSFSTALNRGFSNDTEARPSSGTAR